MDVRGERIDPAEVPLRLRSAMFPAVAFASTAGMRVASGAYWKTSRVGARRSASTSTSVRAPQMSTVSLGVECAAT